jgi:thiol-disulfide isomerase/thioredoxin
MFRVHLFEHKKLIGILALALGIGLPAAGLGQTGAPVPDATKTEAAKPNSIGTDSLHPGEPTDPKARKTFASAIDWEKRHDDGAAESDYRKANKQDGGHCWECLWHAYRLAMNLGAYKDAVDIARDWLPVALRDADKATVHYRLGIALQTQGVREKKDKFLAESGDEFKAALALDPKFTQVRFNLGVSRARLHQDEAAREEFSEFLSEERSNQSLRDRALRYMNRIDLARATMAPPFSVTTLDGQRVSMDALAGKVVLIDFWATWCGPCREALPHIRQIAKRFDGQPLVVLSISLDSDEAKWKDFVGKNGMTWLQYRDGGFTGQIATQFGVTAIPATFTIDADGVLEDQHVGDADIEGKLKKLVARAVEMGNRAPAPAAADKSPGGGQ